MKELKFRVWDKNCKYFIYFGEKYWFNDDENTITFQCDKVMGDRDSGDRFVFQQFTGLKDKNGKEIYEGDIVKVTSISVEDYVGEVIFKDGCFWIVGEKDSHQLFVPLRLEIIGNVHENPELT